MSSTGSVLDFYSKKSIFITGGSGFIGKVLIEKLLRACPDIDRVYLLMRPGRDGKSPQERIADLMNNRIFQFNKVHNLSKLVAVSGDLTKPNLGLSAEDRQLLVDNVSVVFHSAATVRFHGPLKNFISQNVLGTDSIMSLCQDMKKLQAVVYVSTAYANCNLLEVKEKVYPLDTDVQNVIDQILLENSDETPDVGHHGLMGRPNSYTLSKAIAECLVKEKYPNLPVVICRPSIVTHSYKDPVEGWCDSLNGLAGTLLLGGLGIARTMEIDCNFKADIIPVDFVANSLIVIGFHTAMYPSERKQIVHLTSGVQNPITWGQILDYFRISATRAPSLKMIRPLAKNPVSSNRYLGKLRHNFIILFSHILFAYIFDFIQVAKGKKAMMVKVTQKMHKVFHVLKHFTNRQWTFSYVNYPAIFRRLKTNEQTLFASDVSQIDWVNYCDSLYMGSRRYLLNEDDSTIEEGKVHQNFIIRVFTVLDWSLYLSVIFTVICVLYNSFNFSFHGV